MRLWTVSVLCVQDGQWAWTEVEGFEVGELAKAQRCLRNAAEHHGWANVSLTNTLETEDQTEGTEE